MKNFVAMVGYDSEKETLVILGMNGQITDSNKYFHIRTKGEAGTALEDFLMGMEERNG